MAAEMMEGMPGSDVRDVTASRVASLRHQLAQAKQNLRLIEERRAEYVLEVEVPLQLVKEERATRARIAHLQGRLEQFSMELVAQRAGDALGQALSSDSKARMELQEVIAQLTELQIQMGKWKELHHLIHKVMSSFAPFYANVQALRENGAGPMGRRAPLQDWLACQTEVDVLLDFVEGSGATIWRPSRRDWAQRIALLQQELEDTLRDARCSVSGLAELAAEFSHACDCYLSMADRELREAVEGVQRLSARLLGGIQ
jgi:hypothetical protein